MGAKQVSASNLSSSSITEWPSFTRAELGAILLAILILQTGQRVNILTDSQAAIDSINHTRINLTNGKNKIRATQKSKAMKKQIEWLKMIWKD
ncbi:hypothetical protein RhiirA5_444326 [Rhizophagus irregularis]|uniref:RNase H type-1 domain-containing protein n=1 Tax=Rhizophagus irregularis TaxID=588596 RepID=A0A2N0ND93_9GLOM|nr:hypothetical protein RhiirA5_444326 [Rhizophagus irregularis]